MTHFKRRQADVEAHQWDGDIQSLAAFMGGEYDGVHGAILGQSGILASKMPDRGEYEPRSPREPASVTERRKAHMAMRNRERSEMVSIHLPTGGAARVKPGDWIIKEDDEFYTVTAGRFSARFDRADGPPGQGQGGQGGQSGVHP